MSTSPPGNATEYTRLEERVRKLAAEKAGLELLFRLMSRLTELPGLERMIDGMLQSILDTIGGTNVMLYYWIDGQANYADVYGERLAIDRIEDPDVLAVIASGSSLEKSVDLAESRLMDSVLNGASTWVMPLLAGKELIGVLKVEHASLPSQEFKAYLPHFLTYAAAVLKNDIFGHSRLMAAYAALTKSNAALEEARDAAETATRAKSAFLASMSHELRTPLNAVIGFAQLMTRDANITPHQQRNLLAIEHSGQHLLELINDILELSRGEAGKLTLREETFDLHNLLANLLEMVQIRAESKGLELLLQCKTAFPPQVEGDAYRLRQVLINLLNNAVKYTAAGTVTLAVEWLGNSARFEVSDTGQGIGEDELKMLFQPFYQTSLGIAQNDGSGLGLAISRDYVRLLGGSIEVDSEPGIGSRFHFTIPLKGLTVETEATPDTDAVVGLADDQPTWRILVVDDDEVNRRLMDDVLLPLGFEVAQASNGVEAIERFQSWHPHFIWMDTHMPTLNGIETIRRIRTLPGGEALPIMAITATALGEDLDRMLEAGATGFTRKPITRAEVLEKLKRELGLIYRYDASRARPGSAHVRANLGVLANLTTSQRQSLRRAAETLSIDDVRAAIDAIAATDPAAAKALQPYVDDYRLEDLMMSLERAG